MPTLSFKGTPYSVAEDGTSIMVEVELTGATGSDVTFTYEIITGSGDGFATASDYSVIPSALMGMISAGSTEDSLTITITNDFDIEGNETFKVRLKSLSGAVFASGDTLDATVTIVDDEIPELSFKTSEFNPVEEISGGKFEVEVELSNTTTEVVTFNIALGGGTAIKDTDYADPASLSGRIPAGSTKLR